nr:hypothetical protein [Tanacetum cinerariifolium]
MGGSGPITSPRLTSKDGLLSRVIDEGVYVFWQPLEQYIGGPDMGIVPIFLFRIQDPETPLLVGRGFLDTANAVLDCKMAKTAIGEGVTWSVFGVKGVNLGKEEAPYYNTLGKRESYKPRPRSDKVGAQTPYYLKKDFLYCHLPRQWEISRDAKLNPFKDTLVFRRMVEFLGSIPVNLKSNMWDSKSLIENPINLDKPPKNRDRAWHAKIRLSDPDKEEFPKPCNQSRPLGSSPKGKIQWKSSTWTISTTLDGPIYEAILKKKITKKEDVGGNFKIPCSVGGLKHVNALVDQGSDVNIMPYSTYMKLTDETSTKTDIKLSLASHSYIYPLGIVEDVLVEVTEHVYPIDFVILDIKEDKKRPFILGTPFLTTTKAVIKFYKGTITIRSEKRKISFHRIPEPPVIFDEKKLGSS